jgi:methylthioribose-1-phosphate isomerase
MKVGGIHYRSIWHDENDPGLIWVIDQRKLPFSFELLALRHVNDACLAIRTMAVRGAPLIGAAAAWGIYLSCFEHATSGDKLSLVRSDAEKLKATRPTAINLAWATDLMMKVFEKDHSCEAVRAAAIKLCDDEVENCRLTGENGLRLIKEISLKKNGDTVNILTHCNAGWLACIDYGTALAPAYLAHERGIKIHVWVDETRPRNQGSRLTAWELGNHGIPYTLVTDNAGGHLMQNGMVDIVIVGCDRATANGDVANKVGTYLKVLAAHDNNIPAYSAFPVSSFDMTMNNYRQIPVEVRDASEVRKIEGLGPEGITEVLICPEDAPVANYGFDVTPSRLFTGLITEKGVCRADKESIIKMLK